MFLLFAYIFLLFSAVARSLYGNSRVDFLLSAACQRLPKRKEKNRQQISRPLLLLWCCVYARRRELYYSISLFSFSCFVILKLISEWCCGGVECVRNCYAFTTYCCFSSLFLSSSDLKVVLVAHVLLYFSSLLSGKAFWFFPILPHVCKYQDILIWKNLHLCEWWRSEKLSSKRKRCKNIYLSNNTQWTQMRICFAASDWRFLFFGGLFY